MGGATADGPISWRMSSLFLFNIVVGTGVLSLPHIFATAGLLLSSAFLIITAGLSYVCVSWQTEAMAILAAIEHLDNSPLCVRPNFGGTWVEQNGTMAQRVLPKWGRVMWFTTIIVYMLGDLSVYTVFVPSTIMRVFPAGGDLVYYAALTAMVVLMTPWTFFAFRSSKWLQVVTTVTRHCTFWIMIGAAVWRDAHASERTRDVVWFDASQAPLLYGGATYALICQHYVPQIASAVKEKNNVNRMWITTFCTILAYYLVMCWTATYAYSHTLPTVCTSSSACVLQSMYTFNFRYLHPSWLGTTVVLLPLLAVLTNFPLLAVTLRDNIIILSRVLLNAGEGDDDDDEGGRLLSPARDPLRVYTPDRARRGSFTVSSGTPKLSWMRSRSRAVSDSAALLRHDLLSTTATAAQLRASFRVRVAVGILAVAPPFAIGYATSDIDLVVRVTGSYGGAIIMFVMPVVFVWHARAALAAYTASDHAVNGTPKARGDDKGSWARANPFKSPFQHPVWYFITIAWAASAVIVNTYSFIA